MLFSHVECACCLLHDLQDGLLHQLAGGAPADGGLCSTAGLWAADACSFPAVSRAGETFCVALAEGSNWQIHAFSRLCVSPKRSEQGMHAGDSSAGSRSGECLQLYIMQLVSQQLSSRVNPDSV